MMTLDKMKNAFKQDLIFNTMPIAKLSASADSAEATTKNYDQAALSETNYISENKIKEIALANELIKPEEERVSVFITDDRALLDQYYKLRNDIFQGERGWVSQEWFENDFDRKGKIAVAVDESGKVVGGLRVMTSIDNDHLSDEFPGTEFTYPNLFDKMGLNKNLEYIEIDGAVVDKKHRDRNTMIGMVRVAIEYAEKCGCSYLVGISLPIFCRNYKMILSSLGYRDATIVNSFPWKELEVYNNSIDYPIVAILAPKH